MSAHAMMSLLFAAAVDIDKSGSRHLHDKMALMGFCLSYDEIRKFKLSVTQTLQGNDGQECLQAEYTQPFTQYVADTFDHNIRTLDGHGTFHGIKNNISYERFHEVPCSCHGNIDVQVQWHMGGTDRHDQNVATYCISIAHKEMVVACILIPAEFFCEQCMAVIPTQRHWAQ